MPNTKKRIHKYSPRQKQSDEVVGIPDEQLIHETPTIALKETIRKLNRAIDWDLIERKKKDPVEWELFLRRGRAFVALIRILREVKRR